MIFSSMRSADGDGYADTADRMIELAAASPGFIDVESVRSADGTGITVSYWLDQESIASWKSESEHLVAQQTGIDRWYEQYRVTVAHVHRSYTADGSLH